MLNSLLIIIGVIILAQGIVNLPLSFFVDVPEWLLTTLETTHDAQGSVGVIGWMNIGLGIWAIISGIAMFKEEEWAMGQALVILSLVGLSSIPAAINNILAGAWNYMFTYIYLLGGLIGVVGFFYLLITSRRYD
ncbi:MAG: hypothetical protein ACTSV5_03125 [Promethearchaeota archaeon]